MRNSISDGNFHQKSLFQEDRQMSTLPKNIRQKLKKEANEWDTTIADESPEQVQRLLDKAEPFKVPRPARQPVCLRLDPFDISMLRRIARKKGISYTQLMAIWLHERIEKEKADDVIR
jgi:hypothetical protein